MRGMTRGPSHSWRILALLSMILAWSGCSIADTLEGRVVRIIDGDTLVVLVQDGEGMREEKIRAAGIDCPERKQPWGNRAKQGLSDLAFGKEVEVEWKKRDRYKRIVGKVIAGDPPADANLALVRAGLCWWYRKYAHEQEPVDQALYESAEDRARGERRGLWADPDPVPPWEWRRR